MRSRRAAWLMIGVLGFCMIATAVALMHWPADRMLLSHSRIVVPASQFGGDDIQWVSNSELVFERSTVNSVFTQTGIFHVNLKTGALWNDVILKQLLSGDREPIRVSPEGDWLISGTKSERLPRRPETHYYSVGRSDGTRQIRRDVGDGFLGVRWLADNRHWLELYGKHVVPAGFRGVWTNMNSAPVHITRIQVCDLEAPDAARTIQIQPSSLLSAPGIAHNLAAITEDRYLSWSRSPPNQQIVIRELALNAKTPVHQYIITPPKRQGAISLLFTPGGDKILWKLAERREAGPAAQMLHRVIPRFPANDLVRVSLWVSRLDGSQMRDLGGVNHSVPSVDVIRVSGPIDRETGERLWGPPTPRRIRWSPDGKQIGFVMDGAVWVTSAE